MNRNWYAVALLLLLSIALWGAGSYLQNSTHQLNSALDHAYYLAESENYTDAQREFQAAAQLAERCSNVWVLVIRRNLIDQLNQTLATLPAYTSKDNFADLSVETARAKTQIRQIKQSFFGWF